MKKKLDSSFQSKSSVVNKHQTTHNDSRLLKQSLNPLFKIYQIDRNRIWCKSCEMDVFEKDVYKHLYEDQHVHILQMKFIRKKEKSASYHQKSRNRLDIKNQSSQKLQTKKQIEKDNLNKNKENIIMKSTTSYKQFVSKLIDDLNLIGFSNLSLLIAILSETQCQINIFYELTFQQIIENNSFIIIKKEKGSQQFYQINKQRLPEFLIHFIQKHIGSNKYFLHRKSKYHSNQLRSQLKKCFFKIAKATNNKEYQQFLIGLKLRYLKGIALQNENEINTQLQTDETDKIQVKQSDKNEQNEKVIQLQEDQRKSNIRIVIKSKEQN